MDARNKNNVHFVYSVDFDAENIQLTTQDNDIEQLPAPEILSFKIKNTGNTCDVWMTLLYAVPTEELQKGDVQDVHEMTLNLSITTYQNKIRVNIIEVTPDERTLACQVYKPEQLEDFSLATKVIFNKIIKRVEKVYEEFEILY